MSKNSNTLKDLLEKKGFKVTEVWNHNHFYVKNWYAEMEDGKEYYLGSKFLKAVENIVNDTIELIVDTETIDNEN